MVSGRLGLDTRRLACSDILLNDSRPISGRLFFIQVAGLRAPSRPAVRFRQTGHVMSPY
nr:MAG TPA: hypothetical protein [Caudoviricetes sp.]